MKASKLLRTLAMVLTGGMMIQAVGCSTILAPAALTLAENFLLSLLFGGALSL